MTLNGIRTMTKYIAYYRVSTTKQGESGLGLEAQEKTVSNFMSSTGGDLITTYSEVASGRNNGREQLTAAITRCKLTGATLLIAKLDRLSRNRLFLMELDESKINFVCCDMPEANRLTIGIMACMAEYESQLISERTTAALAAAKARGVVLGNKNILAIRNSDVTAATAARMKKAAAFADDMSEVIKTIEAEHGRLSTRKISDRLNEAGYLTPRGKAFTHSGVARIKTRKAMAY